MLIWLVACTVTLLLIVSDAHAGSTPEGVHIIYLREQEKGILYVTEFIDNALLEHLIGKISGEPGALSPSLNFNGLREEDITVVSARISPLIVYIQTGTDRIEERINEAGKFEQAVKLRNNLIYEITGSLFQIPLWTFLTASEMPGKPLEREQIQGLGDYRATYFPAASFAAKGDIQAWSIASISQSSVLLEQADGSGEGSGLVMEYMLKASAEDLKFTSIPWSNVCCYYADGYSWGISDASMMETTAYELFGIISSVSASDRTGSRVSLNSFTDSNGVISRALAAPSKDTDLIGSLSLTMGAPGTYRIPRHSSLVIVLVSCWIVFGLLMVAGNLLFRFHPGGFVHLFADSMAWYPVFLISSFLFSGFWGLGMVPGAVIIARMLSNDGKRLMAVAVTIGACFGVAFISMFVLNWLIFHK